MKAQNTSASPVRRDGVLAIEDFQSDIQILKKLGRGSFGEVFKARHVPSGMVIAAKSRKLRKRGDLSEMEKEISIMRKLSGKGSHHIVKFLGYHINKVGGGAGVVWIFMEHCELGSLKKALTLRAQPLSEALVAAISRGVILGLAALHGGLDIKTKGGVIHRDVKTDNVLLTEDGQAKLGDFGVSGNYEDTMIKKNTMIGTPYYLAPEVVDLNSNGYDKKVDIWSWGISVIECCELEPPGYKDPPLKVLYDIPNSPPPRLSEPSKWSDELNDFVSLCLTKDPENRPNADELLEHSFLQGSDSVLEEKETEVFAAQIKELQEQEQRRKEAKLGKQPEAEFRVFLTPRESQSSSVLTPEDSSDSLSSLMSPSPTSDSSILSCASPVSDSPQPSQPSSSQSESPESPSQTSPHQEDIPSPSPSPPPHLSRLKMGIGVGIAGLGLGLTFDSQNGNPKDGFSSVSLSPSPQKKSAFSRLEASERPRAQSMDLAASPMRFRGIGGERTRSHSGSQAESPFEIHFLVQAHNVKLLKLSLRSLRNGEIANRKLNTRSSSHDSQTPLVLAFRLDHIDMVKLLLRAYVKTKTNINVKVGGCTQLHEIMHRNFNSKTVLPLLQSKIVDLTARDNQGNSFLHLFANNAHAPSESTVKSCMKYLLKSGINVNTLNSVNQTPLHKASWNDSAIVSQSVARLLGKRGSDTNLRDKFGDTPLHSAVRLDKNSLVTILLAYGALVKTFNEKGETVLDIAEKNKNSVLVNMFTLLQKYEI